MCFLGMRHVHMCWGMWNQCPSPSLDAAPLLVWNRHTRPPPARQHPSGCPWSAACISFFFRPECPTHTGCPVEFLLTSVIFSSCRTTSDVPAASNHNTASQWTSSRSARPVRAHLTGATKPPVRHAEPQRFAANPANSPEYAGSKLIDPDARSIR